MNLIEYIKKIGDEAAAKEFNIKPRTAASWRRLERRPSYEAARKIVDSKRWTFDQVFPKGDEK